MHKKWEWWVHDGCYHILLYVTAFMFLWAILSPEILLQQCDHSLPVQSCCSVAKSRPTLCNPMNCSTPGFSVHPSLPEFAQTYVHWAGDAIQPSHPLSPRLLLPSIFPSISGTFMSSSSQIKLISGDSFPNKSSQKCFPLNQLMLEFF